MKDSACGRSRRCNAAFAFPDVVELQDGGTLGLALFDAVASARRVLVFDAVDYQSRPRHDQGAARRRGARLGRREAFAAPDGFQRGAGAGRDQGLLSRCDHRHRRAAGRTVRFRRQPEAGGARLPRPGGRARPRRNWPTGDSPAAPGPTARPCRRSTRRRSRSTTTSAAARPRRTPAASATNDCWRRWPRGTDAEMCVGIPMRIASVAAQPRDRRRVGSRAHRDHQRAAGRRRRRPATGCSRSRAARCARFSRRRGEGDRRRARRAGGRAGRRTGVDRRFFPDLADREPAVARAPHEGNAT